MPDATQLTKFVSGMACKEKRKERLLDGCERTERFEVAGAAAVTFRPQAADSSDALVGDEHMAQLSAITSSTRDDVAIGDDAAAEASTDNRRDGRGSITCAEDREVAPEGSGIAVVEIHHRLAELVREPLPEIESSPIRMDKIGGTFGAEHAAGARGPRSIEADNGHGVERDTGQRGGNFEAGRDLLEADLRTFARKCGMLAEFLDEELLLLID